MKLEFKTIYDYQVTIKQSKNCRFYDDDVKNLQVGANVYLSVDLLKV